MHELFMKYGLKHLSISQVKTISRSPFAWVCEKILKRRGPPTVATTFGSFVHENFEKWLEQRVEEPEVIYISKESAEFWVDDWNPKLLRFWKRYRALQPSWPEKDAIEAEFKIELHPDLPPFIGKIDVVENVMGRLVIQDHKTIGNKAYAHKTPEDVAGDHQLNLYAHAMRGDNEATGCTVQHNQLFKTIRTEKNCARILKADLLWTDVDNHIKVVVSNSLEAIKILEAYDELGIEGFAASVYEDYVKTRWDFGGCPHWDFFHECVQKNSQKELDNNNTMSYNEGTQGEDTMPVDLHHLVGKARDHFAEQGLKKFDLADAIVEAVAKNLTNKNIKAVFIRDGEGGDLIYNQLLNQIAEKNIAIFKKVG